MDIARDGARDPIPPGATPRHRAQQAAIAFLRRMVEAALGGQGGGRLPPLRELARQAGVAQATMQKAVAALKAEALITTSEGRGIRVLRLTAAQRTAVDFLLKLADRQRRERVERLPTVAKLAELAGVSLATMAKAVARARDAGVVTTASGSGVFVAGIAPPQQPSPTAAHTPVPQPVVQRWRRVSTRINADILGGVYPGALPLPSVKELSGRYGVCGKTINKALAELERRGRIVRERARYVAVAPEGGRHRTTVILIARATPEGELFKLTARTITNLRLLENECSRNGLRLVVAIHNDVRTILLSPDRRTVSFEEAVRRETVLGFVVWTMGLVEPAFNLGALVLNLARHRRPIAVFDEGSGWRAPLTTAAPVKEFSTAGGTEPGRQVGRFLLGLGHRHVAWISPYPGSSWAEQRLDGLREEYAAAGLTAAVHPYVAAFSSRRRGRRPPQEQATRWDSTHYLQVFAGRRHGRTPGPRRLSPAAVRMLQWQYWDTQQDLEMREQLAPLYAKALEDRHATAWVGASDTVAIHALDFLQTHDRPVPARISVVGFDNSNESTIRGLTTYSFNTAAYMHAMVSHVMDPRLDPWDQKRDPPITIPGYVTERATTAPCWAGR